MAVVLPCPLARCAFYRAENSVGGLFHSLASRAVIRSALHANRRNEAGQHDSGKAYHHREESRYNMSRRQIAVTDGETGHKGKIDSVMDAPPLDAPDQKSGPDHCEKNSKQDRPDHSKQLKELYEDASDLPWFHWSSTILEWQLEPFGDRRR